MILPKYIRNKDSVEQWNCVISGIFNGKRSYLGTDVGAVDVVWVWSSKKDDPCVLNTTKSRANFIIDACKTELSASNLLIEETIRSIDI